MSQSSITSLCNHIASQLGLCTQADKSALGVILSDLEKLQQLLEQRPLDLKRAKTIQMCVEKTIFGELSLENLNTKMEGFIELLNTESAPVALSQQSSSSEAQSPHADSNDDLMDKFISSASATLEALEGQILELEKGDESVQGEIKRLLHSLKGECGVMDYATLAAFIHEVEQHIADQTIASDGLFTALDWLRAQFSNISTGKALQKAPELHLEPSQRAEQPQQPQTATFGSEQTEESQTLLTEFLVESFDHLSTAESALMNITEASDFRESINSAFRAFHTIKGVSGFMGLRVVQDFAHVAENVLDKIRHGHIEVTPEIAELTLASCDILKEMLESMQEHLGKPTWPLPPNYPAITQRLKKVVEKLVSVKAAEPLGQILKTKEGVDAKNIDLAIAQQRSGDGRKLGEILIDNGTAKPDQVSRALRDQKSSGHTKGFEESIRVPITRLERLLDAVGEAVIGHSMVVADPKIAAINDPALEKKFSRINLIMRQVQELSMSLRMVSLKATFQKMARLVRDLSKSTHKSISFITEGETTEIDKSIVEQIGDPLIHILRNSVDHGIEQDASERTAAGKPETASVKLRAYHKSGSIYIEVEDDGAGIDIEKVRKKAIERSLIDPDAQISDMEMYQYIFNPGFSTKDVITEVSGRGVGLDVVQRNIQGLHGNVEVWSEKGVGTRFTMRLPLTLAIIDGMIVRCGTERYIIPTLAILHTQIYRHEYATELMDRGRVIELRGMSMPLVDLAHLLDLRKEFIEQGTVLVVEDTRGRFVGVVVDEILDQQQVVIKNLGKGLGKTEVFAGGAIMNDGAISLILDVTEIISMQLDKKKEYA